MLQELEDHLPIDPAMRNPKLGALAPIRVVNVVFTAGDANKGVQTAAYNLPNDERVVKEMGSKRVMLKNVQQAKFDKVLRPISRVALPAADRPAVSFDAFFTHILMHELMHGLGPHDITLGGRKTTVRAELKEAYSPFEEAKADISGLWALQYLVDKGTLDKSLEKTMYTTFLASAFRTIRFGLSSSHAPRDRDPAEHAAGQGRVPRERGRDLRGGPREDQGRGGGADPRADHDPGRRGTRRGRASCWRRWRWCGRRCSGCWTG